jgi:hypothetical protein
MPKARANQPRDDRPFMCFSTWLNSTMFDSALRTGPKIMTGHAHLALLVS